MNLHLKIMSYDAVTRFRQGLGRLIRNEDDKGLIVSFDDRLTNSNYKRFSNNR